MSTLGQALSGLDRESRDQVDGLEAGAVLGEDWISRIIDDLTLGEMRQRFVSAILLNQGEVEALDGKSAVASLTGHEKARDYSEDSDDIELFD